MQTTCAVDLWKLKVIQQTFAADLMNECKVINLSSRLVVIEVTQLFSAADFWQLTVIQSTCAVSLLNEVIEINLCPRLLIKDGSKVRSVRY